MIFLIFFFIIFIHNSQSKSNCNYFQPLGNDYFRGQQPFNVCLNFGVNGVKNSQKYTFESNGVVREIFLKLNCEGNSKKEQTNYKFEYSNDQINCPYSFFKVDIKQRNVTVNDSLTKELKGCQDNGESFQSVQINNHCVNNTKYNLSYTISCTNDGDSSMEVSYFNGTECHSNFKISTFKKYKNDSICLLYDNMYLLKPMIQRWQILSCINESKIVPTTTKATTTKVTITTTKATTTKVTITTTKNGTDNDTHCNYLQITEEGLRIPFDVCLNKKSNNGKQSSQFIFDSKLQKIIKIEFDDLNCAGRTVEKIQDSNSLIYHYHETDLNCPYTKFRYYSNQRNVTSNDKEGILLKNCTKSNDDYGELALINDNCWYYNNNNKSYKLECEDVFKNSSTFKITLKYFNGLKCEKKNFMNEIINNNTMCALIGLSNETANILNSWEVIGCGPIKRENTYLDTCNGLVANKETNLNIPINVCVNNVNNNNFVSTKYFFDSDIGHLCKIKYDNKDCKGNVQRLCDVNDVLEYYFDQDKHNCNFTKIKYYSNQRNITKDDVLGKNLKNCVKSNTTYAEFAIIQRCQRTNNNSYTIECGNNGPNVIEGIVMFYDNNHCIGNHGTKIVRHIHDMCLVFPVFESINETKITSFDFMDCHLKGLTPTSSSTLNPTSNRVLQPTPNNATIKKPMSAGIIVLIIILILIVLGLLILFGLLIYHKKIGKRMDQEQLLDQGYHKAD